MKIAVLGSGYVGLVSACCLASSGHHVWTIENDPTRHSILKSGQVPIHEEGLEKLFTQCFGKNLFVEDCLQSVAEDVAVTIIAVGTPSRADGTVDLSQINIALDEVAAWCHNGMTIVMKSTVPPGTGRELTQKYLAFGGKNISYVSNPEFLREGCAIGDWYHPDRIVLGSDNLEALKIMQELYSDIAAPTVIMDVTSAEMTKYAANAFLATKISFMNEIACLCDKVGASVDSVAHAVGMDKRIGPHFLRPGIGYGGSCFPKDTRGLECLSHQHKHSFRLLSAVIEVNANQIDYAMDKMKEAFDSLKGVKICVLGLAFKPGTDDIREAPAIRIVGSLLEKEAVVTIADPLALANFRKAYPHWPVHYCEADIASHCIDAQAIVIATEWLEYVNMDWEQIYRIMKLPRMILDGRNCLDKKQMQELGFQYIGFGR